MSSEAQHTDERQLSGDFVPCEYVHKNAPSEVLLTGWRPDGPDAYSVTALWPADHGFYGAVHGFYDPLLAAESIRQSVILLCHSAYDVPFGHRQAWSHFRYALSPVAVPSSGVPAEVELRIVCSNIVRRGGQLASLVAQTDVLFNGVRVGTAQVGFSSHSPAVYQRLRGPYADAAKAMARTVPLAPPMSPERVARTRFSDVVLSHTDSPRHAQLRVDLSHPALFDHDVDHVPGMLLLEAARQSAHSVARRQKMLPVGMDAVFTRYTELDTPCWIQADPLPDDIGGRRRILISGLQENACVFSTVATLAPVPGN
ncbi:ScbA/BarX family gamma-butyrolactone biosynthesis protein [Streptomyces sp. NBC_00388]|uniref:ScbA/BarX family gamma-butyrolactone biosynthesis protein n=1 Tax=Streptomyces sp. NBC_00388 TaxID=2975735 RepID=UPI002E1BA882